MTVGSAIGVYVASLVKESDVAPWLRGIVVSLTIAVVCAVAPGRAAAQPPDRNDKSGLDRSTMAPAVRPQDDLYMYMNGLWLDTAEIPADKATYGVFIQLDDLSRERSRAIIEDAAAGQAAPGSDEQKVGDLYRSFMDEARAEQLGIEPLAEELARIGQLASHEQLVEHFGYLAQLGVSTPIRLIVDQDDKNSTQYLTSIIQGGTTLPDRDYYLADDEKYDAARQALVAYATRLFELAKIDGPPAQAILDLETALAKVQWERTELRDAEKRYNKYEVSRLVELTPQLPWSAYFTAAQVGQIQDLNVATPSFFEGLGTIVEETPLEVWRAYLQFKLLDAYAPYLSRDFVDAHFELHQRQVAGVPEQKPRWKRAVDAIGGEGAGDFGALGEAVGRLYVTRHFSPEDKARMEEVVDNLLKAFESSIDQLTWMTPTTKQRAKEKLAKITTKIGYPEKWRDYSQLEIRSDDLVGNMMRSARHEYAYMTGKLGQPVDRLEWGMTPQTVNAYYNSSKNEIVFPAAILQPPFFIAEADDAVNYGGIGAVIGHEISHAFDDQGSKYDGDGNLNNWWTDEDRRAFEDLTRRLVDQYAAYEPLPGQGINGQLTLGENIADLSGLSIAHKAYRFSLEGKPAPEIAGWTGDQRFFLGWSQVWRRKYRDAEMVRRLLVDPHSPSQFRANSGQWSDHQH